MKKKTKKIITKIFLIIAILALAAAVFVPAIYYIVAGIKNKNNAGSLNVSAVEQEQVYELEKNSL